MALCYVNCKKELRAHDKVSVYPSGGRRNSIFGGGCVEASVEANEKVSYGIDFHVSLCLCMCCFMCMCAISLPRDYEWHCCFFEREYT